MDDIIKSGVLVIILIGTLIFSTPILNEDNEEEMVDSPERIELRTEKDIHIPM